MNNDSDLHNSTASTEKLDSYSTARHPGTCSQPRQPRQLLDRSSTGSTGKASTAASTVDSALTVDSRQHLDSASTEPRQLDSSTARAQAGPYGSKPARRPARRISQFRIVNSFITRWRDARCGMRGSAAGARPARAPAGASRDARGAEVVSYLIRVLARYPVSDRSSYLLRRSPTITMSRTRCDR